MRVLMLSKACYVAAYRRKLEELAALPEIDLTLVVPPYWRLGTRRDPLQPGDDRGYRTIVMNPVLNGYHHLHFYPRLGSVLRELQPDIFHIDEEPYDFVTFQALWLGRKVGARCLFFTWQNLERRFPFPFSTLERYVLRHAQAAIAGNQEGADILRSKGFTRQIAVIPQFGVDPEVFRPASPSGPKAESFHIGYVGRLVEEKGVLVLLEAVASLQGKWKLTLLGDGPLASKLPALIKSLELQERIELRDAIPSLQMPEFLPGLDVLVLPSLSTSRWKEQFGRVLVEAMACGVPVIGSNSGEIPHVVGQAGLLVPEGEPAALREQLASLMNNPTERERLAQRGRQRVIERFTQQRVAAETYTLYQRLML